MRRVVRLALAGTIWAVLLLVGATAVVAKIAPGRQCVPSPGGTVCLERGRLRDVRPLDAPTKVDRRLADAILDVSGYGAQVQCYSLTDWRKAAVGWEAKWPSLGRLGPWRAFVYPVGFVHVSPELCAELARLVALRKPAWSDEQADALAYALAALGHEGVHVTGNPDEVEATCQGMQWMPALAVALGRTPAEGRYLATAFWLHWYPWFDSGYRSRECRDGGRLDIHPGTTVWP
jgi:hypothetical protein